MAFVGKLSMGSISNFFSSVSSMYNELNPATLSGAVDIVVVEQPDGELACSPFHVRFGKFSLLMPQEKKVKITVNDSEVPYVMKLGEAGEAFFVFETEHEVPEEFQTSPLIEAVDETKPGEEPPYLDIGESKNQSTAVTTSDSSKTVTPSSTTEQKPKQGDKDEFDEDDDDDEDQKQKDQRIPSIDTTTTTNTGDINKLRVPAELQSPKMIIEEQMDKVVTKVDPYRKHHRIEKMTDKLALHHHDDNDDTTRHHENEQEQEEVAKHDTYPLDDGSTLLERVVPAEAVTSTTIARETFIVRPANGDIHSTWLDVTHTSAQDKDLPDIAKGGDHPHPHQQQHKNAEHESIVLDIAGYKTQQQEKSDHGNHSILDNIEQAKQEALEAAKNHQAKHGNFDSDLAKEHALVSSPKPIDDDDGIKDDDKKDTSQETRRTNGWGWGNTRKKSSIATDGDDDTTQQQQTGVVGTKKLQMEPGAVYRVELSLCGLTTFGTKEEENAKLFNQHQITYDTFVHNPNLLNDQRLVFRYEGRYYAAGRTGPLFTSLFLFHEPLANTEQGNNGGGLDYYNQQQQAQQDQQSDSRESYLFGRGWRQWWSRSSVTGPSGALPGDDKDNEDMATGGEEEKETTTATTTRLTTTTTTTSVGWSAEQGHPDEQHGSTDQNNNNSNNSNNSDHPLAAPHKNYAKTLRLTSDQLKSLGLKKGANTVTFSVTTAYQGTATCIAQIFYWDYDIQIVISDIDGTITKSDALGHVFNFIGKDWTHTGVAKLYTDIVNNGYHIMYLTSRAIGQADTTRDYLKRVEQGKHQLPPGPVIMSPDRLFTSFHREVIMRKPEVFKMACLRDIQRLFYGGHNPFYAGFGNRITDAISYRSVDVPASRIFTIAPNGDVKLELLLGFLSSYIHLNDLVDQIFPPINKAIGEEFSDWNYWKQPLPEIDIPELAEDSVNRPPPTSPKPVPIKPDPAASLPSEAVVESEAQKQRQQRGILRSFTSRSSSSSTTTTTTPATPSTSETTMMGRLGERHYSTSTPSLIIPPRSGRTSPSSDSVRSASPTPTTTSRRRTSAQEAHDNVTGDEKAGVAAMPHNTNAYYHHQHHSADDLLTATTTAPAPAPSTSSSLMNKMSGFGGVLSRTFGPRKSSLSEELLDHPSTLSRTGSKDNEQTFDMEDEEEELDLDSIPFI